MNKILAYPAPAWLRAFAFPIKTWWDSLSVVMFFWFPTPIKLAYMIFKFFSFARFVLHIPYAMRGQWIMEISLFGQMNFPLFSLPGAINPWWWCLLFLIALIGIAYTYWQIIGWGQANNANKPFPIATLAAHWGFLVFDLLLFWVNWDFS
jgi:hypothetical protein